MSEPRVPSAERAAFLTVLSLSLGVVVALGFARFAYALLLPAMRADLEWSYTTSGSLNTANAAGYLLGALLSARLLRLLGAKRTFLAGVTVTGVALLATGLSGHLAWLLFIRGLAGASGALAFTSGGVLAAHAASRARSARSGTVLSVFYAGGGLGILVTGLALPALLDATGTNGWWVGWVSLGVVSLLVLPVMARAGSFDVGEPSAPAPVKQAGSWGALRPALVAYAAFAVGYLAYMTFSVALLRERGASDVEVTSFWSVLGVASMIAPWIWGPLLQRSKGGGALASLMLCLAVGAGLPVLFDSPLASFVSAALFGSSFLSVVAATTALVRHHAPPSAWSAGVALFTVVFAAFQTLGPLLTGWVSDATGGLPLGLGVSAGVLLLGASIALTQRSPREEPPVRSKNVKNS